MPVPTPIDPANLDDVRFVVRELSNYTRREEIMQALILRRGYTWAEAGQVVDQIARTNQGSVARRQLPLLITLTIIGFVTSCALLSFGGYTLLYRIPTRFTLFRVIVPSLVVGFTMFGGSVMGIGQVLKAMFKD
ncbi:MAG TPA: hypothetical protein VGD69_00085 [Herpetosiphonaceae bacterium]